jgi:sporulation protein YlmC with PRC-barrel domain
MDDKSSTPPNISESYSEKSQEPRLMRADTLIGENVYNLEGIELGEIKDIMLDVKAGTIAYAVLSYGGFLGIGDKLFAVPWKALKPDDVYKRFILDVDKERLESAPGFDKDKWPDMADPIWQNEVHAYYGTKPYKEPADTPDVPYEDTPYTAPPVDKATPTSDMDTGRVR